MDLLTCFQVALTALRINVLRSVLTMLGIIIGVAAVITMVGVGAGAQQEVDAQINSMGANVLTVMGARNQRGGVNMGAGSVASLTLDDVDYIKKQIPDIAAASPNIAGQAQIVYGNINWSTTVQGVNEDSLITGNWAIEDGREFSKREIATGAKLAIVGKTISGELFGEADPIGQTIRVNKMPVKVIGTLKAKGDNPFGRDQDDTIMMPVTTVVTRVIGRAGRDPNRVSQIMVSVSEDFLMEQVQTEILDLLNAKHNVPPSMSDETFQVRNLTEFIEARTATQQIFNTLLAAIASVSLVVGGIGIMNIMLVSVTERTREIGLRLAVGAKEADIMKQFLVEAITLCMIGGLIGIFIALVVSALASAWSGWPIVIQPTIMVISFVFSGVVGVFFGYYPAKKASRLNPIEALHFE
jgi:putative ABC transport system permease protein